MQPRRFRILSAITAGSLALAVIAITARRNVGLTDVAADARRDELLREARQAPGPAAPGPQQPQAPGLAKLSAREQELVTLVAQGRTDAQIAAQLYISVRTVGSHLDRIRDKTGCRRRADLTRLALTAGLV